MTPVLPMARAAFRHCYLSEFLFKLHRSVFSLAQEFEMNGHHPADQTYRGPDVREQVVRSCLPCRGSFTMTAASLRSVALNMLREARIEKCPGAYSATGHSRANISILHQQARCINLSWALVRTGQVKNGSVVGIVGGGFSALDSRGKPRDPEAVYRLRLREERTPAGPVSPLTVPLHKHKSQCQGFAGPF